jgi:hypothetical protein
MASAARSQPHGPIYGGQFLQPPAGIEFLVAAHGVSVFLAWAVVEAAAKACERRGLPDFELTSPEKAAARYATTRQTIARGFAVLEEAGGIQRNSNGRCTLHYAPVTKFAKTIVLEPKESPNSGRYELGPDGKALRGPDGKPVCRQRTKPESVMVRVPGTKAEVPIDEACTAHGGQGAQCSCPLHHVLSTAKNEAIESTSCEDSVKCTLPEPASPPPESPPQAAPVSPAQSGEQPADTMISEAELLAAIEPLCYDVFKRSPRSAAPKGERLIWTTGCAMGGWHRPVLPFLLDEIRGCRGKGKNIAILFRLAEQAFINYQASLKVPKRMPRGLSPGTREYVARANWLERPESRDEIERNWPDIDFTKGWE